MSSTTKPVAIVTGASSGIGLGIARALLDLLGYRVIGTSRSITQSKDLKSSPDLVLIDGDISKKETAVKVVETAVKHFGRVDLLVNNAGIFLPKAFTDFTEDEAQTVITVETSSPIMAPAESGAARWGQMSRSAKARPSLVRAMRMGSPASISRRMAPGFRLAESATMYQRLRRAGVSSAKSGSG